MKLSNTHSEIALCEYTMLCAIAKATCLWVLLSLKLPLQKVVERNVHEYVSKKSCLGES